MKTVQIKPSLLLTELNGPQLQKTASRFSSRKSRCCFMCITRNI